MEENIEAQTRKDTRSVPFELLIDFLIHPPTAPRRADLVRKVATHLLPTPLQAPNTLPTLRCNLDSTSHTVGL